MNFTHPINWRRVPALVPTCLAALLACPMTMLAAQSIPAPGTKLAAATNRVITAADVTLEKIGTNIPASAIGEPVGGVTLTSSRWVEATDSAVAYALVEGSITPKDTNSKPINFRVMLPASWSRRAIQQGGGGLNGTIPMFRAERPGSPLAGYARYGSDSGHQMGGFGGMGGFPGMGGRGGAPMGGFPGMGGRGGAPGVAPMRGGGVPAGAMGGAPQGMGGRGGMPGGPMGGAPRMGMGGGAAGNEWTLNEEAVLNLAYMQLKKTHDAAMVIMERVYGERPRFNYFIGASQGGREGLTVAQRYPDDYDGICSDVPIVNFSTLMLAPELIRIKEKPLSNWVTRAKANAIRAEFFRQADKLDGLVDGVINNYVAARALFDMSQGDPKRNPWAALRAPDGKDPNPSDTSVNARLTDGQIETLKLTYSKYQFATPLANGVRSFGMWVPNTDPSGSGLIVDQRFRGQEGADANAPIHSHMGVLGVTGFLMQNLSANPLDYVEGGPLNKRREQISEWLDSTNPDLSKFYKHGGKIIVTIGTDDTTASPGAQLDYYQSVLDKMGRDQVDAFARFYVLPQTGHGLSGQSAPVDGDGKTVTRFQIPNRVDRTALLIGWVERNEAPGTTVVVTAGNRSLPMCSYPNYPKYKGGPVESAESYESTAP